MLKLVSLLQRDVDIALAEPEHTQGGMQANFWPARGHPAVCSLPGHPRSRCTPAGRRRFSPCASPLCEGNLLHCRLGYEVQCFSTNWSHRYVLVC